MLDYEIAVELAKAWTRSKHPDKEIEAVPEGETGSFLVRAGRARLLVRVFILNGYRGFIYPGKVLPVPEYEAHIARNPVTYFIFQERLEWAYVLKGSSLEGLHPEEFGDLGRCYLVPKERHESIIDFSFSAHGEPSRLQSIRGAVAVQAGVQPAGASQDAQRVQEIGPLFEAQARPEVARRPDDDYSGL